MFRDRRVVSGAFVMPVFMIIMFVTLIGLVQEKVSKPTKPTVVVMGMAGDKLAATLTKAVSSKVTEVKTRAEGLAMVRKGGAKLFIEFPPRFTETIAKGGSELKVTYDPTEPLSGIALATVREVVAAQNQAKLKAILIVNQVDPKLTEPLKLKVGETEQPKGLGGSSLVSLLPYLIVIWAFYGGFSIVSDLVAGEKERGTMETLLVSPIKRHEVALGKYLALCLVSLTSSLTSLVAILAVGALGLSKSAFPTGFSISLPALLAMLATLIPLVGMFAGILISVSAAAKNMREAQTYLTLVSFVVVMPAVFSQFLGFTDMRNALWVKWTPVLGTSVCLRDALLGKTDWLALLASVATSGLIGAALLWVAVRLFRKETILART